MLDSSRVEQFFQEVIDFSSMKISTDNIPALCVQFDATSLNEKPQSDDNLVLFCDFSSRGESSSAGSPTSVLHVRSDPSFSQAQSSVLQQNDGQASLLSLTKTIATLSTHSLGTSCPNMHVLGSQTDCDSNSLHASASGSRSSVSSFSLSTEQLTGACASGSWHRELPAPGADYSDKALADYYSVYCDNAKKTQSVGRWTMVPYPDLCPVWTVPLQYEALQPSADNVKRYGILTLKFTAKPLFVQHNYYFELLHKINQNSLKCVFLFRDC